jgi:ribosomal-protein-alanine N-acetyltransferase
MFGLKSTRPALVQPPKEIRVHVRWLMRRDMPEVLAIEAENIEFPWREEDFVHCLRQRNCVAMVAEWQERAVGFTVYELRKTQIELLNFAVDAELHRRNVGCQLLLELIGKLHPSRRSAILADVGERNLDAQLFFRAQGFRCEKIVRVPYGRWSNQDAYRFAYRVCAGK